MISGISPLVIENFVGDGPRIRVRVGRRKGRLPARSAGAPSVRVDGTVADTPVDRVVDRVKVRRLICPTRGCCQTLREEVPGVIEQYPAAPCSPDQPGSGPLVARSCLYGVADRSSSACAAGASTLLPPLTQSDPA